MTGFSSFYEVIEAVAIKAASHVEHSVLHPGLTVPLAAPLKSTEEINRDAGVIRDALISYINTQLPRIVSVQTLFHTQRVPLNTLYIESAFNTFLEIFGGGSPPVGPTISERDLFNILLRGEKVLVIGTAGSGKTFTLKHIFRTSIDERWNVIPVFVAFRHFGFEEGKVSILDHVFSILQGRNERFTRDHFDSLLNSGGLLLLFDAFDELRSADYSVRELEVDRLVSIYGRSPMVFTSRPLLNVKRLPYIRKLVISPLSKEKSCRLVEGVDLDSATADRLILDIKSDRLEKVESFVQNPMLLNLMALMYGQIAEIPTKLSIFYNQVFEILFYKHDASKGSYSRGTASGLDVEELRRCFSAMCFITYASEDFSFTRSAAVKYLKWCFDIEELEADGEAVLDDLETRMSLLHESGGHFEFVHRSLQEFFCAEFIVRGQKFNQVELLDMIGPGRSSDQVMQFVRAGDPYTFDKIWTGPKIAAALGNVIVSKHKGHTTLDYIRVVRRRAPKRYRPRLNPVYDEELLPLSAEELTTHIDQTLRIVRFNAERLESRAKDIVSFKYVEGNPSDDMETLSIKMISEKLQEWATVQFRVNQCWMTLISSLRELFRHEFESLLDLKLSDGTMTEAAATLARNNLSVTIVSNADYAGFNAEIDQQVNRVKLFGNFLTSFAQLVQQNISSTESEIAEKKSRLKAMLHRKSQH